MSFNAAVAYLENKIQTSTPEELTLMLYEGMIKFGNIALIGIEEKNIEKSHTNIVKMENIINELRVTLNHKYAISSELDNIYNYIYYRLIEANITKDKEIIEEVLVIAREIRDTWKEAMKLAKKN